MCVCVCVCVCVRVLLWGFFGGFFVLCVCGGGGGLGFWLFNIYGAMAHRGWSFSNQQRIGWTLPNLSMQIGTERPVQRTDLMPTEGQKYPVE